MLQQANKLNEFFFYIIYMYIYFLIPVINLTASRLNRSRENRDASKNRLCLWLVVRVCGSNPSLSVSLDQSG